MQLGFDQNFTKHFSFDIRQVDAEQGTYRGSYIEIIHHTQLLAGANIAAPNKEHPIHARIRGDKSMTAQ